MAPGEREGERDQNKPRGEWAAVLGHGEKMAAVVGQGAPGGRGGEREEVVGVLGEAERGRHLQGFLFVIRDLPFHLINLVSKVLYMH